MKWFRFYSDALDDPKVQRLPGDLFKAWVNILCLASRSEGVLPSMEDMTFGLRLSETEVTAILAALTARGLLDEEDGNVSPHNWKHRQYKSDDVTARVRSHRDNRNVSVTPDETFHETLSETPQIQRQNTETETEAYTEKIASTDTESVGVAGGGADAPAPAQPAKRSSASVSKGTRLPEGWQPTREDVEAMRSECPGVDLRRATAMFRDYWVSQAGAKGLKLDWSATWRNWVRRDFGSSASGPSRASPPGNFPSAPRREPAADVNDRLIACLTAVGQLEN